MELLLVLILGVVAIAVVTALAPRVGVVTPLALMLLGVGVSLLPFVPDMLIDPQWILIGVLPPLLYSAAVSLPAMEFRRDFTTIGGLSVTLVLLTSFALGVFFTWAVPGLGLALAIALGAILSPTDAVATSIVKKLGISPRVVTVLEGESLLNDATALVLLSSALGAVSGSFAFGGALFDFAWAVLVAVGVGLVVGGANLRVRSWIDNTAANTALSFVVPFIAYLPSEHLGGSGLVAAVVAGIVTGQGSPRWFTPEQRLSDRVNWSTIELVLEGAVFLMMGLELSAILDENRRDHSGFAHAAVLAGIAVLIVLAMRSLWVLPLIWLQSRRARRLDRGRQALRRREAEFALRADARPVSEAFDADAAGRGERPPHRAHRRVRRALADLDYFEASPLGWRHGTVIVWAGMRGAVTLAAAQTLPRDTPSRALLVLVAFLVAAGTLLLQGGTLAWLAGRLGLSGEGGSGPTRAELARLNVELHRAAASAVGDPGVTRSDGRAYDTATREHVRRRWAEPRDDDLSPAAKEVLELRLVALGAMRVRLVEVRGDGAFSSEVLRHALDELDAEELSIRLRLNRA